MMSHNVRDRVLRCINSRTLYSENQKHPPFEHIDKFIGSGSSGSVYMLNDGTLLKTQWLRHELMNEPTLNDTDLYKMNDGEQTVTIYDVTVMELIVMMTLSNGIIPVVYDFGYYDNKEGYHCSWITMSQISGIKLGSYVRGIDYDKIYDHRLYIQMTLGMIEELKHMNENYGFVHGDLTSSNVIVDLHSNKFKLIDFGRSQIEVCVDGKQTYLFYINHVRQKMANEQLMKGGVDLCKLLQHYRRFTPEFEKILDKCLGQRGNTRPPVVCAFSEKLTYDSAINELKHVIEKLPVPTV